MLLAENIRRLRRERSLTQEQLAEVLGVTTGAVYKWEAKLSIPELDLIVEMADLFDTSVDTLLGYEMKDNRLEATVDRLRECRRRKDLEGLSEAEKAIKKYPNSFRIVSEAATMCRAFGIENHDRAPLHRALELTEKSLSLLPQNTDPEISEETLYAKMAEIYLGLGETDRAVELWKTHNAGGMNCHHLGNVLAQTDRPDEAVPYLSEALAKITSELCDTISGYINLYFKRGDCASAEAILRLGIGFFRALRKEGTPNFFDKVNSVFLAALAYAQLRQGRRDEARRTLEQARDMAAFFDAAPSYDESDVRFLTRIEGASAHDDIGATAMDAAAKAVEETESEELTALWRELTGR